MSVTPRRGLQLSLLAAALTALAFAGAAAAERKSRAAQAQASLAADSLRSPLTRDNFYFLMPDRFANGDASNDRGGLSGAREVTGFDPTARAGTTAIGSPTSPRSALARLRLVHPALADGAEQNRFSSPEAGIFAFSRIDAGDQVE